MCNKIVIASLVAIALAMSSLGIAQADTLFYDNFSTTTPDQCDINYEYTAGRQAGSESPLMYDELAVSAQSCDYPHRGYLSMVNRTDNPGALFLYPGYGYQGGADYVWVSPQHNFVESSCFEISFDVNPVAPGGSDPSLTYKGVSLIFGTLEIGELPEETGAVGIRFMGNASLHAWENGNSLGPDEPYAQHSGYYHVRVAVCNSSFFQGGTANVKIYVDNVFVQEYNAPGIWNNRITIGGDSEGWATCVHLIDNFTVSSAPDLVYHSTLDDDASIRTDPVEGPDATVLATQPQFLPAYIDSGIASGILAPYADGGYQFPASGLINQEGCVDYYIKLLDNFSPSIYAAPVLFDSQDCLFRNGFNYYLGSLYLYGSFGILSLTADASMWSPGDVHHVAMSWSLPQKWVRLYVDNVLMDSKMIAAVPTVTDMSINCALYPPGIAGNFYTAIDDFKIWSGARTCFYEEAEYLPSDPMSLQSLGTPNAGLCDTAWYVEGSAAQNVEIVPVGPDAVALAVNYSSGQWFTIRPEQPISLDLDDQWLTFFAHQYSLGNIEICALVKGQDGVERSFVVSVGAGQGWRQCLSANIGGNRNSLVSMRPGDSSPPHGVSPPSQLTGLSIRSKQFGTGVCYLRYLYPTNHDFLTQSRWRVWTYKDNLNLVGGIETGENLLQPFIFTQDLLVDYQDQAPLGVGMPPLVMIENNAVKNPPLPAGNYKLQLEITNRYQGAVKGTSSPYRSVLQINNYDPNNLLNTYASTLPLPTGYGTYWVDAKVWNSDTGEWIGGRRFCYTSEKTGGTPLGLASARGTYPTSRPGNSLLWWRTSVTDHIFTSPTTPHVDVKVWKPTNPVLDSVTLHWDIKECWGRLLLPVTGGSGNQTMNVSGGNATYTITTFPSPTNRATAYVVTLQVIDPSTLKVLDQEQCIIGKKHTEPTNSPAQGLATYSSLVLAGPLFTSSSDDKLPVTATSSLYLTNLQQTSNNTKGLTGPNTLQRLDLPWWTFEPLYGLYCFGATDDKINQLKSNGASMQIALGSHNLNDEAPNWLTRESILGQYGCWNWGAASDATTFWWSVAGVYTSSNVGATWSSRQSSAWDAISNHYLPETSVKAYLTWSNQAFMDQSGMFTDYNKSARDAFSTYLQTTLGLTLAQVNSRYGTSWADWSAVQLPQPKTRPELDISAAWNDFGAYKQTQTRKGIFDFCVNRVRAKSDPRPVFFYHECFGGSIDEYFTDCTNNGAVICSGFSNDQQNEYAAHVVGYLHNSAYSSEPQAAVVGDIKTLDSILSGALSGGGCGFIFHHYFSLDSWSVQQEALTRLGQWATAISGMGRAEPQLTQMGIYNGYGPILASSSFGSYISLSNEFGTEAWFKDSRLTYYISPYTAQSKLNPTDVKLLSVSASVLKQSDITAIQNYVSAGGKVFLTGPGQGFFCLERPTEKWVLLRDLGWNTSTSGLWDSTIDQVVIGTPSYSTTWLDTSFFTHVTSLTSYGNAPGSITPPTNATVIGKVGNVPTIVKWPYGNGWVIACVRPLTCWLQSDPGSYVTDLRAWAATDDMLGLASPRKDVLLNLFKNGNDRYLMVFRCGKDSPVSWFLGLDGSNTGTPINPNVKLRGLPGGQYYVYELGPRAAPQSEVLVWTPRDSDFYWTGLPVTSLTEREMRLFRIMGPY